MAITTSIARHFAVRLIVMTIVMLVLGLWGVYDYAYAIPAQQRAFDRYEALSFTQRALQPDLAGDELEQATTEARTTIDREISRVLDAHANRAGVERDAIESQGWRQMLLAASDERLTPSPETAALPDFQRTQRIVDALRATNDLDWMKALINFEFALEQPREMDGSLNVQQRDVYQVTEKWMNEVSKDEQPSPPSTFDRAVQWAFISCLLCVPYFMWMYLGTLRRVYRLEDDGSLKTPDGDWSADEIKDIDMSKWMAKSIAHVVSADGSRIAMDDYKHRNMHLIVGALAHKYHPEEWTAEAKPVKKESEEEPAEAEDQDRVDEVFDGEERP